MGAVACCPSEGKAGNANGARKGGVGRTEVQQERTLLPFSPLLTSRCAGRALCKVCIPHHSFALSGFCVSVKPTRNCMQQ